MGKLEFEISLQYVPILMKTNRNEAVKMQILI